MLFAQVILPSLIRTLSPSPVRQHKQCLPDLASRAADVDGWPAGAALQLILGSEGATWGLNLLPASSDKTSLTEALYWTGQMTEGHCSRKRRLI